MIENRINEVWLNKNYLYIVAVSGGPDSMFLLNSLYEQKYNVVVCHVNYQKRSDSNLDEILVKNYCDKRKITLFINRVTKKDYQQYETKSSNFQEIARLIRYDFFAKTLVMLDAQAVLIAHNLTDHIETFLMQKQRNSKLTYYGLNEQTVYNYLDKLISIIRPMLKVKRNQIIETLKSKHIEYILDYTNDLDLYQRNQIRKKINSIANLEFYLEQIDENNRALMLQTKQVAAFYDQTIFDNKINLTFLLNLDQVIQEKIIFNYFKANGFLDKIVKLKKQRLKELVRQLNGKKPNIIFKVDDQVSVVKSYHQAFFIDNKFLKTNTIIIDQPKSFVWNNIEFNMIVNTDKLEAKLTPFNHFYLSNSDFPLTVTNDLNLTKKVKITKNYANRYFINNKISLEQRYMEPIIFNKNNVFILFKDSKVNNLYLKQQNYLFMIK